MKEKYIEDLKEIKDIMNRSSRFISLSGLSGISAGFSALIGAYLAYRIVYTNQEYQEYGRVFLTSESTKITKSGINRIANLAAWCVSSAR